jgi:hypothetical protein
VSLEKLKQGLPAVMARIEALGQPIRRLPMDHWEQRLAVEGGRRLREGAAGQPRAGPGAGRRRGNPRRPARFADGARFALWTYLLQAHDFLAAYLAAREKLLEGRPPAEVARALAKLSASMRQTAGFGEVVPLDAKYLTFALLGQAGVDAVRVTFRRGTVEVTV